MIRLRRALRAWLQPVHKRTGLSPVLHAADRRALGELLDVRAGRERRATG